MEATKDVTMKVDKLLERIQRVRDALAAIPLSQVQARDIGEPWVTREFSDWPNRLLIALMRPFEAQAKSTQR